MNMEEYVKTHKGSTNVTWTLFVRDNIKRGDYARLNTGEIVKVIGVKENKLNKKAIYFEPYDDYNWCDSMAVKSFNENMIDLIEKGDFVNGIKVHSVDYSKNLQTEERYLVIDKIYTSVKYIYEKDIETILTREQYEQNCYKAGDAK